MKHWVALGVVLVGAALVWWHWSTPSPGGTSTQLPIAATAAAQATVTTTAVAGHASELPAGAAAQLPKSPVSQLAARGTGSDNQVVHRALMLLSCTEAHLMRMHRDIDDSVHNLQGLDDLLRGDAPKRPGLVTTQQVLEARQAVTALLEENRKALAACEALPEVDRRSGMALLQRAAETGVAGARIAYARNAFDEYTSAQALIANLDEVVRRRELVRRFLAESQAQCDPAVWSARFDLRDTLAPGSRDPAAQVAIIQAYYRAEMANGEEADHLQHVHDTLDAIGRGLDASALNRALRQGDADFARCAAAAR